MPDSNESPRRKRRGEKRDSTRRRLFFQRLDERRVLAAITGTVFEDVDFSYRQESSEPSLGGRLVYIDTNLSGGLETGEPFSVVSEDGSFQFDNVADGEYAIRLYDGSTTQQQLFPFAASSNDKTILVESGRDILRSGDSTFTLTDDSVVVGNLSTGDTHTGGLGIPLTQMELLPDGSVMAISDADVSGTSVTSTAFLIDGSGNVTNLPSLTAWSQVAIGQDGTGVILRSADSGTVEIQAIDIEEEEFIDSIESTLIEVPFDAQAIASPSGNRSVLAWAGPDGLEFSLWSNSTATWISDFATEIPGTTQLLAYDDASGLLAVRLQSGGVSVQDVDNQFATIATLDDVTGAVALDGARDLLMTMAKDSAVLELYDLRDGNPLAEVKVDLTTTGPITALALTPNNTPGRPDLLTVLGTLGNTQVSLTDPAAHTVTVENDVDPSPVHFGVQLTGENTPAPEPTPSPFYDIDEDESISDVAPGLLRGVTDAEVDNLVALPVTPPANGRAFLEVNGGFHYSPNENFFGRDQIAYLIHDGRTATGPIFVPINIAAQPDTPTDLEPDLVPVPEDALSPFDLGEIIVIDPDLELNYLPSVSDDNFEFQNGHLIFVGDDGYLDFETQEVLELTVAVYDNETGGDYEETILVYVSDVNEPITAILPDQADVAEHQKGEFVARLEAEDEDIQDHTYTVDDDRFEVIVSELWLKPDVELDYEAEPEIIVNITATEVGTGGTLTEPLIIKVLDTPEPVESISLSGLTVVEFEHGAVVGEVSINGVPFPNNYTATVDDARFEIDGTTLKLLDDQYVQRSNVDEIQLTITAQDSAGTFNAVSEIFIIEVVENPSPFHNDENPFDVDGNGIISAYDALLIINYLNTYGPGPVGHGDPGYGYDVNNDSMVTALDALIVINELNRHSNNGGSTVGGEEPEGEQIGDEPESNSQSPADRSRSAHWDSAIVASTQAGTLADDNDDEDDDDTLDLISESHSQF